MRQLVLILTAAMLLLGSGRCGAQAPRQPAGQAPRTRQPAAAAPRQPAAPRQAAPPAKAAAPQAPAPTAPASAAAPADPADAQAKAEILASDEWREAVYQMNQWLSVQKIYTPQEVAEMRANFKQRVARMNSGELRGLLREIDDKLRVLLSDEARDARRWLGGYMAVRSMTQDDLTKQRPDVVHMTAAQLEQEVQRVNEDRRSRMQAQASFDQQRDAQNDRFRAQQQAQAQASQQARLQAQSRARSNAMASQSQYAPKRRPNPPPPRQSFYVGPFGGIGMTYSF